MMTKQNQILKWLLIVSTAMVSVLITSCLDGVWQKDVDDIGKLDYSLLSRAGELEYIDLDLTQISPKDTINYMQYVEARNRIDQYVELKDGRYILLIDKGESIKISENLFKQFKQIIINTNNNIKEHCCVETGVKEIQILNKNIPINSPRIQSYSIETGGGAGGETKVVIHWYGFDVYISHTDLLTCKTVSGLVTLITAFCGQAEIALISGICYLFADDWYTRYPNGVILSLAYNPIVPGCVPYDVTGQ